MTLPASFLDELRARTPLAALVGRRVKLSRSGRDWKGLCPFHNERSPSFYCYEDGGYHCFGCGANGDALAFVMQTQGLGFREAVDQLAVEAGLEVPQGSPQSREAERRRLDVAGTLEQAQAGFLARLRGREGAAALAYLRERGLSDETIKAWGLGWSGDGRGGLIRELEAAGCDAERMVEAGLVRVAEDGTRREFFFNRVTFPIRDRRGRLISFGGRALGDAKPKYLNGPDTALFSKARTLYGFDVARRAVHDGADLIVVEGYLDVIAMHQAGYAGTVAPLGTALTEQQLEELWTAAPVPMLAFDGDDAGRRAAGRALMTTLPLLIPERGLRIATLPIGEDPDSLIRRGGAAAVAPALDAAKPISVALYDSLAAGCAETTEGRAQLRGLLDEALETVADKRVRYEFRGTLLDRFYAERRARTRPQRAEPRPVPLAGDAQAERARALTAGVLRHPWLLERVEEAFGAATLPAPYDALRDAILAWLDSLPTLDAAELLAHLGEVGLAAAVEQALAEWPMPLPPSTRPDAAREDVESGWWLTLALIGNASIEAELAAAQAAFLAAATAENAARLVALSQAQAQDGRWQH